MAPTTSGLDRAISNDDLLRMQHLVRQQPWLKHSSPFGYSTVFLAARRGSVQILSWLLRHGGDANGRSVSHDKTSLSIPALHAALTNGHLEAAQLLVQHGSDLKTRSRNMDALDHAIARLDADAVAMLLDNGASLDAEYGFYNGFSKVHAAAKFRDADVLEAILSRGGDPFVRIPTRGWTYVRSIMGWGPRDFLMRPGGGRRGREEARLALQVLVKWENFHMRERVRPILRARAVVQLNPGGVIATQRTLKGQPLPTITFPLTPQPHHHTHTPPHVHSHTHRHTAGVHVAHTGVHTLCCCDGRGAPGAVGGGGGRDDDACVVKSGGTGSDSPPEGVTSLPYDVVAKGEGDLLVSPYTEPSTQESDCVGRKAGKGPGVSRDVSLEVAQGGCKLSTEGCVAARHEVRDSARRALMKGARRKTLMEQLGDESKGDMSSVMMREDPCGQRSRCRKRRRVHCPDANPDAVRTRLSVSAHVVRGDPTFTTTRAKGSIVDDHEREREGESGPDQQLVGVVRNLCVVSPELLRHVVSFIITPVPK